MPHFIYALTDPRNDTPVYIGITDNAHHRFKQHISCQPTDNTRKNAWIQGLKRDGLLPGLKILEIKETEDEARVREDYWIHFYINQGTSLFNIALSRPGKRRKAFAPKKNTRLHMYVIAACERKGYSLQRLAIEAGMAPSYVVRCLHGDCQPSRETLTKWCDALQSDIDEEAEIFHSAGYLTQKEWDDFTERHIEPVIRWRKIA